MATKLEIDLPQLMFARDYHEFAEREYLLRELVGTKRVKVAELGFDGINYIGIMYTRKDKDYRKLVKESESYYDPEYG